MVLAISSESNLGDLMQLSSNEDKISFSIHNEHCSKCFNINACKLNNECKLISCKNKCGLVLHECKSLEHLNELCPMSMVDCANKTNGCKLQIKRADMSKHLSSCVASVVRCSSYHNRKIINKNARNKNLKWPDPIYSERLNLLNNNSSNNINFDLDSLNKCSNKPADMNKILLEQDGKKLKEFAEKYPLKFHRMYGYLIGLKEFKDYTHSKFSFMQYLLKNVKSKIFKDIEAENCIVFNDEEGCTACKDRIRNLEQARYTKLKENFNFNGFIRYLSFEDFVERKIYLDAEFLKAYDEFYLTPSQQEKPVIVAEPEVIDEEEVNKRLLANNKDIIDLIELDKTMRLNVAQEVACEAFALQYESYRTKETQFTIECDQLLRRDEYSNHYALYHNYLLTYAEQIDLNCPFQDYGCDYYKKKYDFIYNGATQNSYMYSSCNKVYLDYPSASLHHNKLSNSLAFSVDYLNKDECSDNELRLDVDLVNTGDAKTILDLPFEVLYEIFDRLDSLSLYCLSMTSKVMFFFSHLLREF